MGSQTIELDEDAYEKLEACKLPDEDFSDVVRRLAGDLTLAEYHGILDKETATELETILDSDS
jgi:predicted CopG family antitoxin